MHVFDNLMCYSLCFRIKVRLSDFLIETLYKINKSIVVLGVVNKTFKWEIRTQFYCALMLEEP